MNLENFYIEHTYAPNTSEIDFNWEDDGYTFYVRAVYCIDYKAHSVNILRIKESLFWNYEQDPKNFIVSDRMENYLEAELIKYAKECPDDFDLENRIIHFYTDCD